MSGQASAQTNLSKDELESIARTVVSRQLARDSKGLLELKDFKLEDGLVNSDATAAEIHYTGEARFVSEAAIWTENSVKDELAFDLVRFVPVPSIRDLRGNIEQSRAYQHWKKGVILPFSGSAELQKRVEGWRAASYYRQPQEQQLNAIVSKDIKPSGYILFHYNKANDTLKESYSDKSYTEVPAPNAKAIEAALADWLATNRDQGLQAIQSFKTTGQQTDEAAGGGTYRYSLITAEATLTFTRPAVSLDGKDIFPAPAVGQPAPEDIEESAWKKSLYWPAGEAIRFKVDISFRRHRADLNWEKPVVKTLNPVRALKSSLKLKVTYDERDDELVVGEVIPMKAR